MARGALPPGSIVALPIILSFSLNLLHLALPIYSLQVFNRVLPSGSLATLTLLTTLLIALTFCSVLLEGARSAILTRTALRSDLAVHQRTVAAVLRGEPTGADHLRAADKLRTFRASSLLTTLFDAPWSVAFIVAIYWLHPWLGHLSVVAVLMLAVAGISGPALNRRDRLEAGALAQDISSVFDGVLAQRDAVAAMGLRRRAQTRIVNLHRMLVVRCIRASETQSWNDAATRGLKSLFQILLLALAATLVVTDNLNVGSIVAASMLFARAVGPFERLGPNMHVLLDVLKAWRQVNSPASAHPETFERLSLPAITGSLAVDRVSFGVPRRQQLIVGPISFAVAAGEVLAIVGSQGAGKSTLARLLAGALAPTSGKVRLDGTEIAHFDHEELGSQIGFLPEDVQLGAGSIAEIIARGGAPDPEEIVKAATLAGAHKSIQDMPDGYQTLVQPGLTYLSAGERQQIGLARAFYGHPALIVLDEPTTHLDDCAEGGIVQAIKTLKEGGSTIVFVSRFAGLLHITDRALLLDQGKLALIADQGRLSAFLSPKLAADPQDGWRGNSARAPALPHAS